MIALKARLVSGVVLGAAVAAFSCVGYGWAAEEDAWSAKVVKTEPPFDPERKNLVPADYQALASDDVTQKWHVCVLEPHTGSEYWVAYTYGAVAEGKRQGIKVDVLSAGGYSNVSKQIGQLEDCVIRGANAIVLVTTSPGGLNNAIAEARSNGVVIVDAANGVTTNEIDARVLVSYHRVGLTAGKYLAEKHPKGSGAAKLLYLAGPPGAAYIEALREGFYEGLANSDIEVVKDLYGPSSKAEQLRLVEDGLQTYPDIKYIVGGAPGVEAAVDVLREKGRDDIALISTFQTPPVWDAVEAGVVDGVVTDFAVLQARMTIDTALRILEKKPFIKDVAPDSLMIDATNVKSVDRSTSLAPSEWEPVFSVE